MKIIFGIPKKERSRITFQEIEGHAWRTYSGRWLSHHQWFGKDHPMVNVTVFVDDATSKLTALVFSKGETLESYFEALREHLSKYGRPKSLYTDRFAIFESSNKKGTTQFQRTLKDLDIELIFSLLPSSKRASGASK